MATEKVTITSSLDGSFSLWHFLDKWPPDGLVLAFFSCASTSFALLNLVIIPEKRMEEMIVKKLKKEEEEKENSVGALTLLYGLNILSNLARRF